MKVDKLKLEGNNETPDLLAIGVAGSIDSYRMAYFINKGLGIELEKKERETEKGEKLSFYCWGIDSWKIMVMANVQGSQALFPKAKMASYVILISGPAPQNILDKIKENLQRVGVIQSTFVIDKRFLPASKLKYFA